MAYGAGPLTWLTSVPINRAVPSHVAAQHSHGDGNISGIRAVVYSDKGDDDCLRVGNVC